MNGKATIEALRREITRLQGASMPVPEGLRNQLAALQNELTSQSNQPAPRIPIVQPTPPPPPNLTPDQQQVWEAFYNYHVALCGYSGEVNRSQWLHLVDVAADLTGASSTLALEGYVQDAPTGAQQPWARNGQTGSWVLTTGQPPPTGGPYAWSAASNGWVLTTNTPPLTGGPYGWYAQNSTWVNLVNGVTTGVAAPQGNIGEVISAQTTTPVNIPIVSAAPPTYVAIAHMTLTPGDWNLYGALQFAGPSSQTSSVLQMAGAFSISVGAPPANLPGTGSLANMTAYAALNTGLTPTKTLMTQPVNISNAAQIYLIGWATPNTSDAAKNATATGVMWARRMR